MSCEPHMFGKIVSFEGYQTMNLVMEIAALEIVEDFCRFVDGPWLIVRQDRQQYSRIHSRTTVLVECECCGCLVDLQLPLGKTCLCSRCAPLVCEADASYIVTDRDAWQHGNWD